MGHAHRFCSPQRDVPISRWRRGSLGSHRDEAESRKTNTTIHPDTQIDVDVEWFAREQWQRLVEVADDWQLSSSHPSTNGGNVNDRQKFDATFEDCGRSTQSSKSNSRVLGSQSDDEGRSIASVSISSRHGLGTV
jgi:hypothetical protein